MLKILVDSASDININEAKELGVSLISMQVRFGTDEYLDGVDIMPRQFFEKLVESDELPQTSQINETRFAEKFEELTADGSEVLYIALSSKLSGTYDCAVRAAQNFGGKVHVVDSYNVCVGERILIMYALRLMHDGKSASEIVKELDEKKGKIQLMAVLDTLEYLKKGGRISTFAAVAGSLLSIKPVISIVDGEVKIAGKALGSKKSSNLLTQLIDKCGGIDFSMPYVLGYSGFSDEYLKKYINDSERLWRGHADDIPSYIIGSTIGTHAGPNAIAVAFFAK